MNFIQRFTPWALILWLLGICIWQWQGIAIMPDEISIRIQAGRFIQDHGTSFGLYALCADRILTLPWIFIPSAWLLSLGDLNFSPADLRIASLTSLTACLGAMGLYAASSINRMATLWLPAAVIGVAASTLVYFRFETFITFNLTLLMLGMLCLKYKAPHWLRACCAGLCVLSLLCMAYTHPQAQLFMPLNGYITYRLLAGDTIKPALIAGVAALFVYIGFESHEFFKLSCKAYPGIEAFWKQMVLDTSHLEQTNPLDFIAGKFDTFTSAFLYKDSYKIDYLPALRKDILLEESIISLNALLPLALGVTISAGFIVAGILGWLFIRAYVLKKDMTRPFPLDGAIAFGLIFFPTVFYFLYDANLYFYRSHFLNLLFVCALTIGLSQLHYRWVHYLTLVAGGSMIILALQSSDTNNLLFIPKLEKYEGPSTSLTNKWILNPQDALAFANSCGIDVTKGGGIVSDYTHAIAKPYYRVYPLTYLSLQMSLAGIKAPETIRILKPNYVLGRCTEMEQSGLGWPADKRSNDLCCARLDTK